MVFIVQKDVFLQSKYIQMSAYTIRIDNETKIQFDRLCEMLGMSVSTAVNLFIRKSIREQAIPFRLDLRYSSSIMDEARQAVEEMRTTSEKRGLSTMTIEEINEEIRKARKGE